MKVRIAYVFHLCHTYFTSRHDIRHAACRARGTCALIFITPARFHLEQKALLQSRNQAHRGRGKYHADRCMTGMSNDGSSRFFHGGSRVRGERRVTVCVTHDTTHVRAFRHAVRSLPMCPHNTSGTSRAAQDPRGRRNRHAPASLACLQWRTDRGPWHPALAHARASHVSREQRGSRGSTRAACAEMPASLPLKNLTLGHGSSCAAGDGPPPGTRMLVAAAPDAVEDGRGTAVALATIDRDASGSSAPSTRS